MSVAPISMETGDSVGSSNLHVLKGDQYPQRRPISSKATNILKGDQCPQRLDMSHIAKSRLQQNYTDIILIFNFFSVLSVIFLFIYTSEASLTAGIRMNTSDAETNPNDSRLIHAMQAEASIFVSKVSTPS